LGLRIDSGELFWKFGDKKNQETLNFRQFEKKNEKSRHLAKFRQFKKRKEKAPGAYYLVAIAFAAAAVKRHCVCRRAIDCLSFMELLST